MHARIPEFPLRRRFWERVIDGPIGALVLAGRKDEAEKALNEIADPAAFAGASADGKAEGRVTLVGAGPGDPAHVPRRRPAQNPVRQRRRLLPASVTPPWLRARSSAA